jgi:hypothetical protein
MLSKHRHRIETHVCVNPKVNGASNQFLRCARLFSPFLKSMLILLQACFRIRKPPGVILRNNGNLLLARLLLNRVAGTLRRAV